MTMPALALAHPLPDPDALPVSKTAKELAARPSLKVATLDDRQWIIAYRKARGWFKTAMADKLRRADGKAYSREAYSKWEDGKYGEDPETSRHLDAAVRAFREKEESERAISRFVGFRPTIAADHVALCVDLLFAGAFVVMHAKSGAGKTENLNESRRIRLARGGALPIYLEATVFTSGAALMGVLASEVGIGTRGNPDMLLREIARKLQADPRPIILDEANWAAPKAIEALRQLHDLSGVGVLLSFTSDMVGGGRGSASTLLEEILAHKPAVERITRRAYIREVPGISDDEVAVIAEDVLGDVAGDALDELIRLVRDSTGLMVRLIDELQVMRGKQKLTGPVDKVQVAKAWKRLYLRQTPRTSTGKRS